MEDRTLDCEVKVYDEVFTLRCHRNSKCRLEIKVVTVINTQRDSICDQTVFINDINISTSMSL